MKRRIAIGAALVAVLAAAATTYALAASGASTTQTINACVNDNGEIRLVSAAANCRHNESPISWNTVGPAGAQGAQGIAGRDGQTGAQGPAGPAGAAGEPPPDPDSVAATVMATGAKQGPFSQTPIAVTAVSHEVISPRDPVSGLPTGKRQHKPITITMDWGASTPLFLNALVNNETLTSVLIGLLRNGNQVATIKLTNASVSDYVEQGDHTKISFTYQKIEWTWVDGGITASDDWEAPVS
jgi:type VI secretion system secreted protein Hcp